jgi:hypothetical protein
MAMSGLDNSQQITDEASLHAEEIHHEHHKPVPGSPVAKALQAEAEAEADDLSIATAPGRMAGPAT